MTHTIKWRLVLAEGVTVALGVSSGIAVAADQSSADAATSTSPNLAVLLHVANAKDLNAADVQASVLPTGAALAGAAPGTVASSWPVPATDILASGNTVELVIPPAAVPDRYVSASGVANFDILVGSGASNGAWHASAQAASVDGTTRWVAIDTVVHPVAGITTTRSGLRKVSRNTIAGSPRPVAAQTMSLSPMPAPTTAASRITGRWLTDAQCQHLWTLYYLSGLDPSVRLVVDTKTVRPWATIGVTYPTAGDHAWFSYAHGDGSGFESSFGVALSTLPNLMDFHVDGSYKVTNSAGYGYESPHNTVGQAYQTQIKYRKLIMYRFPAPPPLGDGQPFSCDHPYQTMWVPVAHLGNFLPKTGLTRPRWTHCVKEGAGTWWRSRSSGYAYEKGGGVKIGGVIGFNLKSTHEYSSESKVVYHQQRTEWLCGNNATPSYAGKIMESKQKL